MPLPYEELSDSPFLRQSGSEVPSTFGQFLGASAIEPLARPLTGEFLNNLEIVERIPMDPFTLTGSLDEREKPDFTQPGDRLLSPDRVKAEYADIGLTVEAPVSRRLADIKAKLRREDMIREDLIARGPRGGALFNLGVGAAGFAATMAGALTDPLNIASAFIPVVGQARFAGWVARFGIVRARAMMGMSEGLIGAAAVEPLTFSLADDVGLDYTMTDALVNVSLGGLLGAGLHVAGGAVKDRLVRTKTHNALDLMRDDARTQPEATIGVPPETIEAGLRTSVAQGVNGKNVDVEAIFRTSERTERPSVATKPEGTALPENLIKPAEEFPNTREEFDSAVIYQGVRESARGDKTIASSDWTTDIDVARAFGKREGGGLLRVALKSDFEEGSFQDISGVTLGSAFIMGEGGKPGRAGQIPHQLIEITDNPFDAISTRAQAVRSPRPLDVTNQQELGDPGLGSDESGGVRTRLNAERHDMAKVRGESEKAAAEASDSIDLARATELDDRAGEAIGAPDPETDAPAVDLYLEPTEDSRVIPIDSLRPVRAREDGIANARFYMDLTGRGEGPKHRPLSLKDEGDGTFSIRDGNSTFAVLQELGVEEVHGRVLTDKQFQDETLNADLAKRIRDTRLAGKWLNEMHKSQPVASIDDWPGKFKGVAERAFASRQLGKTMDQLYEAAPANNARLKTFIEKINGDTGLKGQMGPIKLRKTAEDKISRKAYDGPGELKDIVRGTVEFTERADVDRFLDSLNENGGGHNLVFLDMGFKHTNAGYVDRKIVVRFPDGMVGEIIFIQSATQQYKTSTGHDLYKIARNTKLPDAERQAAVQQQANDHTEINWEGDWFGYFMDKAAGYSDFVDELVSGNGKSGSPAPTAPKESTKSLSESLTPSSRISTALPSTQEPSLRKSPDSEKSDSTRAGRPPQERKITKELLENSIDKTLTRTEPAPQPRGILDGNAVAGEVVQHQGRDVHVRSIDPAEITTDAKQFQFKAAGDEAGVTKRLSKVKKWAPLAAGKVIVFQRLDGTLVIADGHQRLGLANRLLKDGNETNIAMDAYVFREADGWEPGDVRAEAAKKNLMELSGDPMDIAKILRERPELLDESVAVTDTKMEQATGLAKLTQEAFGAVINDVIPMRFGSLVGEMVPLERHMGVISELNEMKPRSTMDARIMIREIMRAPEIVQEQVSLFGAEIKTTSLVKKRTEVLSSSIRALKSDRRIFAALEKESGRIEEAGNVLAKEENALRASNAAELSALIETLASRRGPVSDALSEAAILFSRGSSLKEARDHFVSSVTKTVEDGGMQALLKDANPDRPPARDEIAAFGDDELQLLGEADTLVKDAEDLAPAIEEAGVCLSRAA